MSETDTPVGESFWGDIDVAEALERYKQLIDAVDDGIYQLDSEGHFVGVNERIVETTGYSRDELLGEHVSIVLDDADIDRIKRDFRQRVREGGDLDDIAAYDISIETADGETLICDLRITLLISDGEFRGSIGIVRDVTEQKQRERHVKGELDEVLGRISEAFYAVDTEWRFTHVNERMEELVGMTEDELVGERRWDVLPEAADTEVNEMDHRAMETGEALSYETYSEPWDGWYEFHLYPSETGMSVYVRDVTERKAMEEELREREERFRMLADNLKEVVWMATPGLDEVIYVNPAYETVWGDDREALYDDPDAFVEAVHPDDRARVEAAVADLPATEFEEEYRIVHPDGEVRWIYGRSFPVRADGEVVRVIGIAQDVTERREMEEELRESEAKFRQLAEHLDQVVWMTTADQREILYVNPAFEEVYGQNREALYEDPEVLLEAVHPEDREMVLGELDKVVTDEYEVEYRIVHPDGEVRWLHDRATPIYDDDGDIYRIVGDANDVTERNEREQKLEELVDRLEESNDRLEQFAYAASHDLQEPLRMVSTYLQLIETRHADDLGEQGQEFLEFAVDGADRMRNMVDGLLQYSRVDSQGAAFEPVDCEAVFADVRRDLQVKIEERDARITAGALPSIQGDRQQVAQVFQNLLDNAIEYIGDAPPQVDVAAERDGDEWVISVSDNGIGIDPTKADQVFELFQSLHSRSDHDGTGIGLALCKRIVERHDGDIWVDSAPGDGATFSFTLPALPGEAAD